MAEVDTPTPSSTILTSPLCNQGDQYTTLALVVGQLLLLILFVFFPAISLPVVFWTVWSSILPPQSVSAEVSLTGYLTGEERAGRVALLE